MGSTGRPAPASPGFLASGPADGALDVLPQTGASLPQVGDEESYNVMEPPPLDWRSESSSDVALDDLDEPSCLPALTPPGEQAQCPSAAALLCLNTDGASASLDVRVGGNIAEPEQEKGEAAGKMEETRAEVLKSGGEAQEGLAKLKNSTRGEQVEGPGRKSDDDDHHSIHSLLNQLQLQGEERPPPHGGQLQCSSSPAPSPTVDESTETTGLLFSESHQRDLLGMLELTEISAAPHPAQRGEVDAVVSVSYSEADAQRFWPSYGNISALPDGEDTESVWKAREEERPEEEETAVEREEVS